MKAETERLEMVYFSDSSDSIRSYLELKGINNQSMDTDGNPAPQKSRRSEYPTIW